MDVCCPSFVYIRNCHFFLFSLSFKFILIFQIYNNSNNIYPMFFFFSLYKNKIIKKRLYFFLFNIMRSFECELKKGILYFNPHITFIWHLVSNLEMSCFIILSIILFKKFNASKLNRHLYKFKTSKQLVNK